MDQKDPEEQSLLKSKHRNQNCGLKKIVLGGPKENEARKAFRKEMKAFGRVEFTLTHQKRLSSSDFNPHKGRGKDQKGKDKEGAYPQSGFSASENPVEEGQSYSWESDDWYSNITDESSTSTTAW